MPRILKFTEETLNFKALSIRIILPFSRKWEEGLRKQSKLEKIKEYILRQL